MDDKKFQKAIDALLEQQAMLYSDLEEIKEIQKGAEKRMNVLERVSLNFYDESTRQGKNIAEQSANVAQLSVEVKELIAAQKETDDRLNAVIFMAEKFFSGQNGKSKK